MPNNTETFVVEFTKDEAEAFVKLLDIAVKSAGLSQASPAVHLHQKLDKAYRNRIAAPAIPNPS